MRIKFNYFDRQYLELKNEISDALSHVVESGSYILGGQVINFEREFASFCGAKYSVGVGNGLDAIYLSLRALGIKEHDEVLVPSNTYIATWIAVSRVGAVPIPVEPNEDTFNINPSNIEEKITNKTKAIVPVDLYGQPCEIDSIVKIASEYDLKVVVDAAQSHGAEFRDKKVGSLADVTAFSFYPTKNLGAYGDGGAIVTNNQDIAEMVSMLRNYGTFEKYNSKYIGINSRLDEIQAALLRVKLKHLNEINHIKREIATCYLENISSEYLQLPYVPPSVEPVWHQFVVKSLYRDKLKEYLSKNFVETIIHYPVPPHLQKAYEWMGLRNGSLPIAEKLSQQILSIPIDPYLKTGEVEYIVNALNGFHP